MYERRHTKVQKVWEMTDETKRVQISIHLDEVLLHQLETAAKREIRSVSGEAAYRLRRSFERSDRARAP